MARTLQLVGAVSLVLWVALGLFAWSRAAEGIHVTLSDAADTGDGAPDELALLADRVDLLATDLDRLGAGFSAGFDRLVQTLQAGDDEDLAARGRLEQRLASLEGALPAARADEQAAHRALERALDRLESLADRLNTAPSLADAAAASPPAADAPVPPPNSGRASPLSPPTVGESSPVTPPDVELAGELASSAAPATAPTPVRRSFLSFTLPQRDFRFAGRQRFELLPRLSRVGFDAKSTLHDFTGAATGVQGAFTVDLAHPEEGLTGRVEIRADALRTGLEGRDEAMLEHLETEEFERIVFVPSALVPERVDPEARTLKGELRGELTVHGRTRPVRVPVEAEVDPGRRLVIAGEFPLKLSDYDVAVPSKLGVISVEDELRVWIRLRARARAEAAE